MASRGYLVFGDIDGKVDILRVECTKCPRKGQYRVARLIEQYGRMGNMMKWKNCSTGIARSGTAACMTAATWSVPIYRKFYDRLVQLGVQAIVSSRSHESERNWGAEEEV
jgi:hypothetical protein